MTLLNPYIRLLYVLLLSITALFGIHGFLKTFKNWIRYKNGALRLKLCSTNIDLEPLSRRRDRADLCENWKQLNGRSINHALTLSNTTSTRGNSRKPEKKYARLDPRKYYFSNRVVNKWNSLKDPAALAPTLASFKDGLELTTY